MTPETCKTVEVLLQAILDEGGSIQLVSGGRNSLFIGPGTTVSLRHTDISRIPSRLPKIGDPFPAVVADAYCAATATVQPDYRDRCVTTKAEFLKIRQCEKAAVSKAFNIPAKYISDEGILEAKFYGESDCPDCHGTRQYQPLVGPAEPCRTCCGGVS